MTTDVSKVDAAPEPLSKGDAARLSRLERKIGDAMKAAGQPVGEALTIIRDEKLYRATHKSFAAYVLDRWGFSRATAYRMIEQAAGLVLISPPESEKEQVNVSHGETKTPEIEIAPAPSSESPVKTSEGVAPASETVPEPPEQTPSGKSSAEEGGEDTSAPPPADPPSGGARATAPPPRRDAPTEAPPASRPAPPDPFDPIRELVDDLQSCSTVDLRAYNGPWRVILETEVRRAAEALGIVRRQGTVTPPAARAPKPPAKVNGSTIPPVRDLTRREVTPMFKP